MGAEATSHASKLSFPCATPTIYSGMNSVRLLSRVAGAFQALIVGAVVLLLTVALGVAVDAWVVNHDGPTPGEHAVHIRHYLLPLGGFALFVIILWRFVLPAAGDAARTALTGGTFGQVVRHAFCAIVWFSVDVALFECAAHLQRQLFGFFLPG